MQATATGCVYRVHRLNVFAPREHHVQRDSLPQTLDLVFRQVGLNQLIQLSNRYKGDPLCD